MSFKSLLLFGFLCLVISSSPAVPVPLINVTALTEESDLVILGYVSAAEGTTGLSTNLTSGVEGHDVTYHVRVDSVLKGAHGDKELLVKHFVPDAPIGYVGIRVPSYAMFFLKKVADDYRLTSPYYGAMIADPWSTEWPRPPGQCDVCPRSRYSERDIIARRQAHGHSSSEYH